MYQNVTDVGISFAQKLVTIPTQNIKLHRLKCSKCNVDSVLQEIVPCVGRKQLRIRNVKNNRKFQLNVRDQNPDSDKFISLRRFVISFCNWT